MTWSAHASKGIFTENVRRMLLPRLLSPLFVTTAPFPLLLTLVVIAPAAVGDCDDGRKMGESDCCGGLMVSSALVPVVTANAVLPTPLIPAPALVVPALVVAALAVAPLTPTALPITAPLLVFALATTALVLLLTPSTPPLFSSPVVRAAIIAGSNV